MREAELVFGRVFRPFVRVAVGNDAVLIFGAYPGIGFDLAVDEDRRKEIALGEQRRAETRTDGEANDARGAEILAKA